MWVSKEDHREACWLGSVWKVSVRTYRNFTFFLLKNCLLPDLELEIVSRSEKPERPCKNGRLQVWGRKCG